MLLIWLDTLTAGGHSFEGSLASVGEGKAVLAVNRDLIFQDKCKGTNSPAIQKMSFDVLCIHSSSTAFI